MVGFEQVAEDLLDGFCFPLANVVGFDEGIQGFNFFVDGFLARVITTQPQPQNAIIRQIRQTDVDGQSVLPSGDFFCQTDSPTPCKMSVL